MEYLTIIGAVIGTVTGIISLAIVIWKVGYRDGVIKGKIDKLESAVVTLEKCDLSIIKRIDKLEPIVEQDKVKVEVFWKYLQDNMGKIIHSDHTPDIDRLIEKNEKEGLTNPEILELIEKLEKEYLANGCSECPLDKKIAVVWYISVLQAQLTLNTSAV